MKGHFKESRRKFIQSTSKIIAGVGMLSAPLVSSAASKIISANDKVRVALIGARGMGFGNLSNALKIPNVECAALCDIDDSVLASRSSDVEKIQGKTPLQYKDYRKVMDNKDIDAVIIGTPDHWHCLPFVHACEAGKDIYVEKPLANSIAECEVMVGAARKHKRVVQVGQQQRSGDHWKQAMEFMKSGNIGQLRKIQIWANFNYGTGPAKVPDEPVPAGVDYNMWLGPAPERSFNTSRFHGSWRMFWDYGGGLMTDWGVHLIDMGLWAKDVAETPIAVTASGGNWSHSDHAHETFDTMSVHYEMKDFIMTWENTAGIQSGPYGRSYGLAFIGNDATLVINRDGWELFPEMENGGYKVPAVPKRGGKENHPEHIRNFIECIKTRKDPTCPIESGRLVALYAHMGNIALRTKSRVEWNDAEKNFGKNTAANLLIKPEYRRPWVFPNI